jgi:predicted HicB family RNase H-like nuclease
LEEQWCGPTGLRGAGVKVTETPETRPSRGDQDEAIADEVSAVRAEYAEEEAEAAEREAAENAAALEVSLSLRITRELDLALKRRAAQEQISPSALVRRLLRQATTGGSEPVLTARQVEEIARRVVRESA